jgi:HSP20 family protein
LDPECSTISSHSTVQNKPDSSFTSYKYTKLVSSFSHHQEKFEKKRQSRVPQLVIKPKDCIRQRKKREMALIPSFFDSQRGNNIFDPFSSLDIWDPFKDLTPFISPSNSLFSRENPAFVNTRIDWKETPEAHVFQADLPGLKKEEVKVEIEDDRVLQISGQRNVEKEDKNDTWHRVERSSGKFLRRFRLPENARMDQIKACMENGVLTVTVPKEEVKKPDVKTVEISE